MTILFNSSQCNTNYVQVPGSRDPGVSAAGGVLGVQHAAAEPGYQQTSPCSQHDCRHGVTSRIIIILHNDNNDNIYTSTLQVCLASRSPAGYRCQCDPGYEGETLHYIAMLI